MCKSSKYQNYSGTRCRCRRREESRDCPTRDSDDIYILFRVAIGDFGEYLIENFASVNDLWWKLITTLHCCRALSCQKMSDLELEIRARYKCAIYGRHGKIGDIGTTSRNLVIIRKRKKGSPRPTSSLDRGRWRLCWGGKSAFRILY